MNIFEVVQRYWEAWNQHDPQAIVTSFTPDGIYRDPAVPEGLAGEPLAEHTRRLFMALPDARFNLVSQADIGNERVLVEWHLVASPAVSLAGCDVLVVEQRQLRSVQRYFDQQTLRQQMGEDAWSSRVSSGSLTPPGAFSLTWIDFRPEDLAHEQNAQYGPRIVGDLMREAGFITWLAAGVGAPDGGARWFTITAWEDVDQVQKGMGKNAAHQEALRQFFQADFGQAVHTSVWIPHRVGGLWVRCRSCKRVSDYQRVAGRCPCGEALSPQPAYW